MTLASKRRIWKEFRSLLWPWAVAGLAALLPWLASVLAQVFWWDNSPVSDETFQFLNGIGNILFFGSVLLIAALSFGTELQQRTLGLLLVQPLPRIRLWNEKLAILGVCVVSASLLQMPTLATGRSYGPFDALLGAVFIVSIVCSTAFWTLSAGSIIGGAVFSVASFFLLITTGAALLGWWHPSYLEPSKTVLSTWLIVGGLAYGSAFLWLGWRKFYRMQLVDNASSRPFGSGLANRTADKWLKSFRCRPRGIRLNLIRKELRLQQPVFMMAAVFAVCWLITAGLFILNLLRPEFAEALFSLLTALYLPLCFILAGCISVGEEKAIGLTAWHFTLPISIPLHWLTKLLVSFTVAVVLGLVLPFLLSCLLQPGLSVGVFYLLNEKGEPLHAFALVLGLMGGVFLLSFWASTFFAAAIRAALATVLGVGVIGAAGAFAAWCGRQFDGLQKPLVKAMVVQFQLPPDFFSKNSLPFMIVSGALLVGGLALLQSVRRYRNSSDQGSLIKNAAALLLLLIGLVFIGADFQLSAERRPAQVLEADLNSLLAGIVNRDPELLKSGTLLRYADLEATGALDDELKRWLRNATIKLSSAPPPMELLEAKPEKYNREFAERYGLRLFGNRLVQFEVLFPNGRSFNSSLSF